MFTVDKNNVCQGPRNLGLFLGSMRLIHLADYYRGAARSGLSPLSSVRQSKDAVNIS